MEPAGVPRGQVLRSSPGRFGCRRGPRESGGSRLSRVTRGFQALTIRDFRYLFISTIISGFGQWGQMIGMGWLVFDITGSAAQLGAVSAVGGGVRLFAGMGAGVMLDRFNRRSIMIWTTIAGAIQGGMLGVLVLSGTAEVWHIYIFASIDGFIAMTNQTARQAFVYDVTTDDQLANAVAVNAMGMNMARIVGPPLVAAMIGFWGLSAPFLFILATLAISTYFTLRISQQTRQAERATGNPFRNLWDGLKYVLTDRPQAGLALVAVVPAIFVYPYVQLLPVFADEVLNAGEGAYGLMAGAIGWGSFVGLMGLTLYGNVERKGRIVLFGMLAYCLVLVAFTQSSVLWLTLIFLTIAGVFHGVALTITQTLVQMLARNDMRGRATAVFQMGFGLMPVGALPMGFAIERWGAQAAVGTAIAISAAVFAFMSIFWVSLRRA